MPEIMGTGKPIKLKRRLIRILADAIGVHGLTVRVACRAANIRPSTYYEWLRIGRENIEAGRYRTVHAELVYAMERARSEFETTHAQRIIEAAMEGDTTTTTRMIFDHAGAVVHREVITVKKQDWRASKFLLACNFPERWSERLIQELHHEGRVQVQDAAAPAVTEVTIELVASPGQLDPRRDKDENLLALTGGDASHSPVP